MQSYPRADVAALRNQVASMPMDATAMHAEQIATLVSETVMDSPYNKNRVVKEKKRWDTQQKNMAWRKEQAIRRKDRTMFLDVANEILEKLLTCVRVARTDYKDDDEVDNEEQTADAAADDVVVGAAASSDRRAEHHVRRPVEIRPPAANLVQVGQPDPKLTNNNYHTFGGLASLPIDRPGCGPM